jgi:hypothetical protein
LGAAASCPIRLDSIGSTAYARVYEARMNAGAPAGGRVLAAGICEFRAGEGAASNAVVSPTAASGEKFQ